MRTALTANRAVRVPFAAAGFAEAASKHGQGALAGFRKGFGADHPYVAAVPANTDTIGSRLALTPEPLTRISLEEIDFTPLPL